MTKAEALRNLQKRFERETAELNNKYEFLEMLPDGLPSPWFSDSGPHLYRPEIKGGTAGFTRYGVGDEPMGFEILEKLESAGWVPQPVSLVAYANYRASAMVGVPCEQPVEKKTSRYQTSPDILRKADRIGPVWFTLSSHTGVTANAAYLAPNGNTYKIQIGKISAPFRLSGRREEIKGGWRYTNAFINVPETFVICNKDSEPVYYNSPDSKAYLSGDTWNCKSLEGYVYLRNPGDTDLAPSEILRAVENYGQGA